MHPGVDLRAERLARRLQLGERAVGGFSVLDRAGDLAYDLNMASLYKKVIHGRPYWYLREMGWVDGKPKMVSERYVGTAAEVGALLDAREQAMLPERTRHLEFGPVAAVWGLLDDLQVAALIDAAVGPGPAGLPLSVGTYLGLAALNRVVDPRSKRGFAEWWRTTAADRFTKIGVSALDHRRFWDAMHALPVEALAGIEEKLALAVVDRFALDTSSVALDMTNFATFIDTGNTAAPIAQRGKAKQKRADLRLVGLGLVVTRAGGIPLLSHAYPGNKPDVTQFPAMIATLAARHAALAAAAASTDTTAARTATDMTVVFDAGQNSEANFALLADTLLHYVGSVPASDCPDLLALPASARSVVDEDRYGGLSAYDPAGWSTAPNGAPSSPIHPSCTNIRPAVSTAPPWPRPARNWTSWPPPWPAATPAAPAPRSKPRSPRSPATPGPGA
jgi:hypothetical protein